MPTVQTKIEFLKGLNTRELIDKLPYYEEDFEKKLREDALFRNQNVEFLGSYGSDCPKVKRLLAELATEVPDIDEKGNKITNAAARDAWLERQRASNNELANTISKQHSVAFTLEDNRISIDMAKRRLEGLMAIIEIRTAQINFLREH